MDFLLYFLYRYVINLRHHAEQRQDRQACGGMLLLVTVVM